MIAALFVAKGGCYFGLEGVDPWDDARDARGYAGPWPVVAHPPCERWGRYWGGGPMLHGTSKQKRLGDDGGCFASALRMVHTFGGVLEHPEASHAWAEFGIARPPSIGGWVPTTFGGFTCCVEQGHYSHRARKKTWLYTYGVSSLPELVWGPSRGERLDEGFHSKAERDAARAAGVKPRARLSKAENLATPLPFRDLLLSIARSARSSP